MAASIQGKEACLSRAGQIQRESLHTGSTHATKETYSVAAAPVGQEGRWKHREGYIASAETQNRFKRDTGTSPARNQSRARARFSSQAPFPTAHLRLHFPSPTLEEGLI